MQKPKAAVAKRVVGGGEQEERTPRPALRRGCTLSLATPVLAQDQEERGRKWDNRGPGQGMGESSTPTAPTYQSGEKSKLSLKWHAHTTSILAHPPKQYRYNNVEK